MNGFEPSSGHETGAEHLEALFPDDFSPDEIAFARELHEAFPVDREELPPLYVQTLLEDEWREPVASGYEHLLVHNVFRRLRLPRGPLFPKRAVLLTRASLVESVAQVSSTGRSAIGAAAAVFAMLMLSVLLTTPSFAAGLRFVLGQTGVQQVRDYPSNVHGPIPVGPSAAADATAPLYWLGQSVGGYAYLGARWLAAEDWSKGPIVEVTYGLTTPATGSGLLDLRMFRISDKYSAVLQVVSVGSATETQLANSGAVYVDGAWVTRGVHQSWQRGGRSELIFERDGVIFWLVGDQRDGLDQGRLVAIANQLEPTTRRDLVPVRLTVNQAGREFQMMLRDPTGDETYALVPRGKTAGDDLDALVQFQTWRYNLGGD